MEPETIRKLTSFWWTFWLSICDVLPTAVLTGIVFFRQRQLQVVTRWRNFCLLLIYKELEIRLNEGQQRASKENNGEEWKQWSPVETIFTSNVWVGKSKGKWSQHQKLKNNNKSRWRGSPLPMPSLPLSSDSSESEPSSDSLSDSFERQAEQGAKVRERETREKLFRQIVLASRIVLTSDIAKKSSRRNDFCELHSSAA